MGLMGPLNMQGENLVIDSKIVELQNSGLINLVGGGGEIKFKTDGGGFVMSSVKTEVSGKGQEEGVSVAQAAFQQAVSPVTYSIVAPVPTSTTFTTADYSNYQSFG
jgi:hypothetical protein